MGRLFSSKSDKSTAQVDLNRLLPPSQRPKTDDKKSFRLTDKRFAARQDTWVLCSLTAENKDLSEVVIVDISKTGVRIRLRTRTTLPATVWVKAQRIGLNRKARLAWQNEFNAGLEFISAGVSPKFGPSTKPKTFGRKQS
ncbi:MAG: PilZ domain-containing protein [Henriciella sp.]|nr:PilZ domain-containing protein [Henriciella sp.]